MNYRSMAKSASSRRSALKAMISSTQEELAAMEKELVILNGLLKAIPGGSSRRSPSPRRKGPRAGKLARKGKWKSGKPGRPPKWYLQQQKAKGGKKPAKKAAKEKPARRKRKASAKQLAAMTKAREALAAKRAAASTSPPASP